MSTASPLEQEPQLMTRRGALKLIAGRVVAEVVVADVFVRLLGDYRKFDSQDPTTIAGYGIDPIGWIATSIAREFESTPYDS